jgi:hypothetical protein
VKVIKALGLQLHASTASPSTSDGTEPEVTYIKRARTLIADYKAAKKQMYERGA